jgi:hypothetical protein
MPGDRIRDAYDKMARGRMLAGKKADPVEVFPQGDAGRARDQVGRAVAVRKVAGVENFPYPADAG